MEDFFKIPEPLIQKEFSRIMSLKDGTKKMSKSEISDLSRINLTDDKDLIINKIKKAKTDSLPLSSNIQDLEQRPEAKNLLRIYSSLNNLSLEQTIKNFEGKNFSEFKEKLSQVLFDKIEPISKEIKKLMNEKDFLDKILLEGCKKANNIASDKVKKMQEIIGF